MLSFKNLFKEARIGNLPIANRLVVPPMVVSYCNEDGTATERFIAYHEEKAKGGWGLIITENFYVDPRGKAFTCMAGFHEDRHIEGYRKLT